jgi:hypothetical protein
MKIFFWSTLIFLFGYVLFAQNSESGFGPLKWGASIDDLKMQFNTVEEIERTGWEEIKTFNVPIGRGIYQEYSFFRGELFDGCQKYYPISMSDCISLTRSIAQKYGKFNATDETSYLFWKCTNFYRYYRPDLTIVAKIIESRPGNYIVHFYNPLMIDAIREIYPDYYSDDINE